MAFYYVKSGGTATGDAGRYATEQTGSFASLGASGYYDSLEDAFGATTIPTQSDSIRVSHLHNNTSALSGNINAMKFADITSVDDSNCDQYKPGAKELSSGAFKEYQLSFNASHSGLIAGMDFGTDDIVLNLSLFDSSCTLIDCTVRPGTENDVGIWVSNAGPMATLKNVTVAAGDSNATGLAIASCANVVWYGGAITTATKAVDIQNVGGRLHVIGVDLSPCTTLISGLVAGDDKLFVLLDHCKLNASAAIPTMQNPNQRFEMYNCDDVTGNAFHRFLIKDYVGQASNNDSTYVTATQSWYDGTDKSSIEVSTTAGCSHAAPFIFNLPAQIVDLSDAGSDLITIDLVSEDQLTDTDIAAFLVYPDGVTKVQANWVTSGKTVGTGNYGIDPLAAGTNLPTSALGASDWTGETGITTPVFSKLELDTSGDAGSLLAAEIRIEIYKPSIASGDLFIHPVLSVS